MKRLILTVTSGPDTGERVRLCPGESRRVGRARDADLMIAGDPLVSRSHFSIECTKAEARIRDLGSGNGTVLNGREVVEDAVVDGDVIVIGETTLLVRIENDEPQENDRSPSARARRPQQISSDPPAPTGSSADTKRAAAGSGVAVGAPAPSSVPGPPSTARRPYATAFVDSDAGVRRAALLAAAWAGEPWLLEHCARLARRPSAENWDAIHLLTILGRPSHLPNILSLAKDSQLGARRFEALGTFGHPEVIPVLLKAIADSDPVTAAAAGAAFDKITGAHISSGAVVTVVRGQEGSADEAESDAGASVSVERAQKHWNEVRKTFASGTRWCRGFDVSGVISAAILDQLDLESRWEACLRGRFDGTWKGNLMELEVYPQARELAARQGRF